MIHMYSCMHAQHNKYFFTASRLVTHTPHPHVPLKIQFLQVRAALLAREKHMDECAQLLQDHARANPKSALRVQLTLAQIQLSQGDRYVFSCLCGYIYIYIYRHIYYKEEMVIPISGIMHRHLKHCHHCGLHWACLGRLDWFLHTYMHAYHGPFVGKELSKYDNHRKGHQPCSVCLHQSLCTYAHIYIL